MSGLQSRLQHFLFSSQRLKLDPLRAADVDGPRHFRPGVAGAQEAVVIKVGQVSRDRGHRK